MTDLPPDSTAGRPPSTHGSYDTPRVPAARGVWNSRAGFVLAAVGSAVGLGNMWRFPYYTAENGGAAFVLLYIVLTFVLGIPLLLAEMAVGRRTQLSPIGALRKVGGKPWVPLGFMFVFAGFLILAFYSVIAGWVTRYALSVIFTGFPADPGAHFTAISSGLDAIGFHIFFMALTISIVMAGVEKGIERASLLMMPTLFALIIGLALWAATLVGSGEGYSFYLAPSFSEIFSLQVFGAAAAQAAFSLSLGMGAILTFASYLSRDENLPREGTVIAFADFGVAFVAGLVVFPVIFALGLQGAVGESTVGALFIALPGAFDAMGGIVGRVVGSVFFLALLIGALTSAISLLEVVTSSVIDEFGWSRKKAAIGMGVVIALVGIWPALDLDALGAYDSFTGNVLLPLGALAIAILVGWVMKDPVDELVRGSSEKMRGFYNGWIWVLRLAAPAILLVVLWSTVPQAFAAIAALFA